MQEQEQQDNKILYKSSYADVDGGRKRGAPFTKKYSVDQRMADSQFTFGTLKSIDRELNQHSGSLEDYFKLLPPVRDDIHQKSQRDRLAKSAINQSSSTATGLEKIDDVNNY